MKKMLSALAVGSLCVMPMMGETYHTKGYGVMQTEDIYTVTVGPGTVETKTVINFSTSASDNVADINAKTTANILKVDLTNKYVTPKVGFVDDYKIQDLTMTVPKLMEKHTSYQNHYFAGVNGDFFGYITCGVTVADGKYVYAGNFLNDKAPFEGTHFIIDKDGLPYIADHIEFGCGLGILNGLAGPNAAFGEVTFPDGTTYDEMRYNAKDRWDNYLVLCSPYVNRTSTGFNIWGTEVELRNAGNQTMFGAAGEFKVGKMTKSGTGGDMAVPADGYVLSGNGKRSFNDKVSTGSKVKISIPFKADGVDNSCRETVGGWPRLVTDGTPISAVPPQTPGDLGGSSRRARTAVGFSQDRKTLYIIVLDEGTSRNQGMTFKALGSFMEAIGCYNAMNLDGGGSSVLHVENLGQRSAVQGVMNGYNRPVMNGLFLATNAPETREISSIEIIDKSLTIKPGKGYVPTIYGYNKYGVLVCTNVTEFTLSAPEGTATFNSGDRKMIAPQSGEFILTAKYGDATFELPVKVSANGIDGEDPNTEATFAEQKTTPVPEKPADWEDDDPAVNPGDEKEIYVAGNFNSWKPEDPLIVKAAEGKTDVYEFDVEYKNPLQFKFTTLDPRKNGGWAAFKAGDNGVGTTWHTDEFLVPGKAVELIPGNLDNIETPWAGNYHIVIDTENALITATTETPRPALTAPEHLYLIGDLEGHAWDTTFEGAELTGADGVFTVENVTLAGDEAAYFAFITKTASSWDEVNASPRYGAWKADAEFEGDAEFFFECWNSWKVAPGEYNFTVDFNTGKVTIEKIEAPVEAVKPILQDVTPWGYNFDNYEDGAIFKVHSGSGNSDDASASFWTSKPGIYDREAAKKDGHFTSFLWPGGSNAAINTDEKIAEDNAGITIRDFGGYLGKCLVINQMYSPLATATAANPVAMGHTTNRATTMGIGLYCDKDSIQHNWPGKAIRVRIVLNIMRRGCHAATQGDKGMNTAFGYAETLAEDNGGVVSFGFLPGEEGASNGTLKEEYAVPINGSEFAKWENEGTCVAEIPANPTPIITLEDDPYDNTDHNANSGGDPEHYLMQLDRFMVYEWDVFTTADNQNLKINLTFASGNMSIVIKEIKFFNINNANDLLDFPDPTDNTNFTYGPNSMLFKRCKSWRYYTEKGVKEFAEGAGDPSGVEEVIAGDDNNAPVEYYNLQGIRVNNPSNGIYIVRQGSKTRKVLIR